MTSANDQELRISIRVETITPTKAAALLKNMGYNRPISPSDVNTWATDMLAHRWTVNGETIKISTNGKLMDGQHRLLACIKAGVSFRTYVIRGLNEKEVIHSIDVGRSRTPANFLGFHGFQNANMVTAAARVFHEIGNAQPSKSKGYQMRCSSTLKSRAVLLEYLQDHAVIVNSSVLIGEYRGDLAGWLSPSLLVGIHAFTSEVIGKATAAEFAVSLADGAELSKTSIIYKLRQRLQRESHKVGQTMSPKAKLCLILRTWNRWITNTPGMATMGRGENLDIPRVLGPGDKFSSQRHTRKSGERDERKRKARE